MYNIGSKDVGVLSGLVIAIERNKSHRQFYHGYTLIILEDLVTGSENSLYMGSEELGLLPALVELLSYSDNNWDCMIAIEILNS